MCVSRIPPEGEHLGPSLSENRNPQSLHAYIGSLVAYLVIIVSDFSSRYIFGIDDFPRGVNVDYFITNSHRWT